MIKTYATRKEMMEANGWTEVAPGVYSANNTTSTSQSSGSRSNSESVKAHLEKELNAFKSAKSAQRTAIGGRR